MGVIEGGRQYLIMGYALTWSILLIYGIAIWRKCEKSQKELRKLIK